MHFHFSTFNHCPQGRVIVEDITQIIGAQMAALGHTVSWTEKPVFLERSADVYNVVLESFADDPATIEKIGSAHAKGCRFIIVATEEPTDEGFNHGLEPAMIDRQNAFPAAAKFASGILHLVPGRHVTSWYAQFAPAAAAELGYAPALAEIAREHVEPDHDFGFYGKITWRREQMLARFEQGGSTVVRITSLDVPREDRDRQMRRARVILQIRANEEWGMVSSTRCASALSFGRAVIAEPHPAPAPWDRIVHFSPTIEAFYADAVAASLRWHSNHYKQFARFKETLTPEVCIGRALREIGIT